MVEGDGVHAMTLADGRALAWLEVGDPDGTPVVSCHGGLSSRLDVAPAHEAAERAGVRLISPDRPGIGFSDRKPDRTLLDWPDDVRELVDHLGVDRFGVLGWSLGGAYAAATAFALAERTTTLGLVASVIPATWDDMREELNRMDRVMLRLSEHAAPIDRVIFALLRGEAAHLPKAFARQAGTSGDAAASLPEATAAGLTDTKGVLDDYHVFGAPWGFEPGDLRVPTHLWQGDADDLVPSSWGDRLADAIDGAELHVVPGGTHFLAYDHWDEVLTPFAATA
ncbi:MAG: alpha/beta hydrolase [Acidimicrobiales bacterium]